MAQQPPRVPEHGVSRHGPPAARPHRRGHPSASAPRPRVERQGAGAGGGRATPACAGGRRSMSTTATGADAVERTLSLLDRLFEGYRCDFAVRLWDGTERRADEGEEARFTLVLSHEGALRKILSSPSRLQLSFAE